MMLAIMPSMTGKDEPLRKRRLIPTGDCWCGCGQETELGKFFRSGHDKIAEAAVIRIEYGTVPEFLVKHGYGPDGKNPRDELERDRQKKR
jgi:hypothetical protein